MEIWERMVQTTKSVEVITERADRNRWSTCYCDGRSCQQSTLDTQQRQWPKWSAVKPNHLLHLRPTLSLLPGLFDKEDLHSRHVWRQAQYLSGVFWRRWSNEHLPTLMEGQKWRSRKENIKVGDLVLLADENYPCGEWPIARVWEVVADDGGCVRVAKVKTASMVATHAKRQGRREVKTSTVGLTRPVTSLCRLEMED